jgi:hypothetical protein
VVPCAKPLRWAPRARLVSENITFRIGNIIQLIFLGIIHNEEFININEERPRNQKIFWLVI